MIKFQEKYSQICCLDFKKLMHPNDHEYEIVHAYL